MALTKQEYRLRSYEREMTEIFESLEWQLYQYLEQADSILAQMAVEASSCQIPAEFREKFIRAKLIDMFEQMAERREAAKPKQKRRARK